MNTQLCGQLENCSLVALKEADVGGRGGQIVLGQSLAQFVCHVDEPVRLDLGEAEASKFAEGAVEVGPECVADAAELHGEISHWGGVLLGKGCGRDRTS